MKKKTGERGAVAFGEIEELFECFSQIAGHRCDFTA